MNTPDQAMDRCPHLSSPYVGMRPFARGEEAIFTGRERDAVLLRDKVFSAKLTIFYGPSGIGKSSIINTLLVPLLEKANARVVFCRDWHGDDPLEELKSSLAEEAQKLKVTEPRAGSPNSTDLVRLVLSADDRTLVLILDQFEEFLNARADRLDGMRRELGALVRAVGVDVRLVLSLREEHLASLEPFRSEILNLFQSTYRLEPLMDEGIREAIEGPAKLFGFRYESEKKDNFGNITEEGLVTRLIEDLRHDQGAAPSQATRALSTPVDLPMLQLVCDELWKGREECEEKDTISLKLYRKLGGRQGILDQYLRKVVPKEWKEKTVTAKIMKYLAPRSGYKMAYAAEDLAEITELPPAVVKSELERLSDSEVHVLRSRRYGGGRVLYELYHDKFISIVTPWREEVLKQILIEREKAKRWEFIRGAAGVLVLIILALFGYDYWELRSNVEGKWSGNASVEQKLDHIAYYLLLTRSSFRPLNLFIDRYSLLKKFLEDKDIPSGYGISMPGSEFITLPQEEDDWSLTFHYSSDRKLDEIAFTLAWQGLAQFLQAHWGIPVPLKLHLVREDTYPKKYVKLSGKEIKDLEMEDEIPIHEDDVYIDSSQISEEGLAFLNRFSDVWQQLHELSGGPWYVVPRWSLPVWKSSGIAAQDGSGLTATLLVLVLQKHPDRLLTPEAAEILLKRAAERYPQTVREVRAVRGDRITGDLQEIIRQKTALKWLPNFLDALAGYPEDSPEEIPPLVLADISSLQAPRPLRLYGPHSNRRFWQENQDSDERQHQIHQAYREADKWLPGIEPPVRIYLGKSLDAALLQEGGRLIPELLERIEKAQDTIMRRFGVEMDWQVRRSSWSPSMPENAFRIEVSDELDPENIDLPSHSSTSDVINRIGTALENKAQMFRVHLLTAEFVDEEINRLADPLKSWILKRYSLTDLKLLLRAIINPNNEELVEYESGREEDLPAFAIPPENTVRRSGWLMSSLIFFSQIPGHDSKNIATLVDELKQLQRGIFCPNSLPSNQQLLRMMEEGIKALSKEDLPAAERAFAQSIKIGEKAAVAAFRYLYPKELHRSLMRQVDIDLDSIQLQRGDRIEIEDLLTGNKRLSKEAFRRLRLGLLSSYSETHRHDRRMLVEILLTGSDTPDLWPPHEAAWFASKLLSDYDPLSGDESIPRTALAFLVGALPHLNQNELSTLTNKIRKIITNLGPNKWCVELLPSLAEARPDPYMIADFALMLSEREAKSDLELAAHFSNLVKKQAIDSRIDENERTRLIGWANIARIEAMSLLSAIESDKIHKESETTLRDLTQSTDAQLQQTAYVLLLSSAMKTGRITDCLEIIAEAKANWPTVAWPYSKALLIALSTGDRDKVADIALQALGMAKKSDGKIMEAREDFAYLASQGLLVTETGAWEKVAKEFLATDNENAPYISIMLSSRMTGKDADSAKAVIDKRWARAKPETWKQRSLLGDKTVWREMLMGYYRGEIRAENIFPVLEDEAKFAQSDLRHLPLFRTSMLCEAYFYKALLARDKGNHGLEQESLSKAVATEARGYFEYYMAKFLLSQPPAPSVVRVIP
jgi:hypothetical protein